MEETSRDQAPNQTNAHTEELVRICWYYYKLGMTQAEIAARFRTNRVRIMKALDTALAEGIVEIRVKHPYANLLMTERKLVEKLGLTDAVVVPSNNVQTVDLNLQLGMAAAQYVRSVFKDGDILAIGWGDSVSRTIKFLSLDEYKDFYLVSLSGGLLPLISEWHFFGKYLNRLKVLPAPLLVSSESTAKAIYDEPEAREILRMWVVAQHAIIGIGALTADATIVQKGYISEVDLTMLRRRGAVGDILGHFLDKDGTEVPYDTDKRLISQSAERIRDMRNVIAVAGGLNKLEAIRAAIKGGYIDTLVTDEGVAARLLEG